MASSVLNTQRAVEVSVFIVRAFVRLRETLTHHVELALKFSDLERHLAEHDEQILSLISAIRNLMSPVSVPKKRRIGFRNEPQLL